MSVLNLESFGEVGKQAKALGDDAKGAISSALYKGAQMLVPTVKAKAPRSLKHRTGGKLSPLHLADTITADKALSMAGVTVAGGANGPSYYWKYLEHGTVKMAARPFFAPALEEKAEEVHQTVADELKEKLGL